AAPIQSRAVGGATAAGDPETRAFAGLPRERDGRVDVFLRFLLGVPATRSHPRAPTPCGG
ncbi:MAG TPA: hypothetical protein DEB55_05030, partial [Microbacterium sp.]|nr:hypothetical protein [Microbacterium sp.]